MAKNASISSVKLSRGLAVGAHILNVSPNDTVPFGQVKQVTHV
jgi:hypothetical protein